MPAIIIISLFICALLLFNHLINKERRKNYDKLIDTLGSRIQIHLKNIKVETSSIGAKGGGYHFVRSELLITEDALIIFGWGMIVGFKQLTDPLILTKNPDYRYFSFAKFIQPVRLDLNSFRGDIHIGFVHPGLIDTEVDFHFNDVSEEIKQHLLFLNALKISRTQP